MRDLVDLMFGTYPSWSHLVVRLALGVVFFAHGAQKAFGWWGGPEPEGWTGVDKARLLMGAAMLELPME